MFTPQFFNQGSVTLSTTAVPPALEQQPKPKQGLTPPNMHQVGSRGQNHG